MSTEHSRLHQAQHALTLLSAGGFSAAFAPWSGGEQGQQAWLKLSRDDETALFYAGAGGVLEAEIQKGLMKALNEGWSLEGELHVSFDGTSDALEGGGAGAEACLLELGSALLPLVDPYQNAPLLERLRLLRREVARDIGFVTPGVQVVDNLALPPGGYRVLLRGAPVAGGEIFLDRFLAVGSLEQLSALKGWSTIEPSYGVPARWIEPAEREAAEAAGCALFGALGVLVTHLREAIKASAADLLGLQETHTLVARLGGTHPVVVEEFVHRIDRLRKLRHVLRGLLAEGVSIANLVTIVEVVGDHLPDLDDVPALVEEVRKALGRQIMAAYAGEEGGVRGLLLDDALEERVRRAAAGDGVAAASEDGEALVKAVRTALEEHGHPPVLFTAPEVRRWVRHQVAAYFPQIGVLSLAEIPPGLRVEIAGRAGASVPPAATLAAASEPAAPPAEDGKAAFWKTKRGRK